MSSDEAEKKGKGSKGSKKSQKRPRKESSSSDEGPLDREPVKKSGSSVTGTRMTNEEGSEMMEIGSMRYVTVREFRGKSLIDIREYYMDKGSGQMKPGKKGISMTKEQFTNFKTLLPEIEEKLK